MKNTDIPSGGSTIRPLRILILALLLFNVAFFGNLFLHNLDRVTLEQLRFRLDFRYWPFGTLYLLWFVLAWLSIDAITFKQRTRPIVDANGKANSVRVLTFTFKLLIAAVFAIVCINPMRFDPIQKLFVQFYFLPMTNFFCDGSISWRLSLPPLTALAAIAVLLHINRKFKQKHMAGRNAQ